ncbi:hypothetical protein L579_2765 [Pantoea sp. AS-PWVM4]|nr:hypothetical protein L579_2765 [Pantoea sp. AS-PWVM4]
MRDKSRRYGGARDLSRNCSSNFLESVTQYSGIKMSYRFISDSMLLQQGD